MIRARESAEVPELHNAISQHFLTDTVSVIIYSGLWYTIEQARRSLGRKDIVQSYRWLSGVDVVSTEAATNVVLGEIQNQWYLVNGQDIPQKVMSNQERRLQEAVMAKAAAEGDTPVKEKAPRVTNRSIIETGLLNGDSDEKILKAVKKQFPDGKADESHIKYYRHALVKAGQLEAQPRAPRVAKAKEPKTIEEAAKGNSRPVKATQAPAKVSRSAPRKTQTA